MARPLIVGVLNLTPDSFHDGGKFTEIDTALRQAEQMIKEGADILELGGESTGPKSPDVALEEERKRVIPVLQQIKKRFPDVRLSVDTYKSLIAAEAIEAGATMINDVTAGRGDSAMFSVLAPAPSVELVLMFAKDATPRTTINETQYKDVIVMVSAFLKERRDAAVAAGIDARRIWLDPGLGHFVSSDPQYSFALIARLREFSPLGHRLFLSPSRKSFVAGSEKLKTVDRLPGTIAASALAVFNGASAIRTHDVLEVRRACEIAYSIQEASF